MIKGFLFDLDGTLLDTARDMLHSLQLLAQENNVDITPDYRTYKNLITHGSKAIVASVFGHVDQTTFSHLQSRYLQIYQQNLTQKTCFFDGVKTILSNLENRMIPWGVVTNKPYYLSAPLIETHNEFQSSRILIGGDSTPHSKPHPHPLLEAAKYLQTPPESICYVGDAHSDIEAAKAAKMQSAVASWGYISKKDDPVKWNADKILFTPEDLLDLI